MTDVPPFKARITKVGEVDQPWKVLLVDLAPFTSITVEFFGCAGGIFRYFPRGRDQMAVSFQHKKAGDAQVLIVARDEAGLGVQSCWGEFKVAPSTGRSAMPFGATLGDDEDGEEWDDWDQKMIEIDIRFSGTSSAQDHGGKPDRRDLASRTVLPAQGKPPMSEPWHPENARSSSLSHAPAPDGASFFASTARYSARHS